MQTLENVMGMATSTKESATVALNASQETYAVLEAERKGKYKELLAQAVQARVAETGCSEVQAYADLGRDAMHLKELAAGKKPFCEATQELKAQARNSGKGGLAPA